MPAPHPILAIRYAIFAVLLTGCSAESSTTAITIFPQTELAIAVQGWASFIPKGLLHVDATPTPSAQWDRTAEDSVAINVAKDLICTECYRLTVADNVVTVHAGDGLGAQYGLSHALELLGFRFFQPWSTYAPERSAISAKLLTTRAFNEVANRTITPDMSLRGLQLHTLHPIESLYAFWIPSAENLTRAKQVIDWLIKNRGNFLQWVALSNIIEDGPGYDAWHPHTRAIIDYAHQRGIRVGMNVQLFPSSNLQQAFDLLPKQLPVGQERAAIAKRLALILKDLPLDHVTLSFGEFFSQSPQKFIDTINIAYEESIKLQPNLTASSLIHVGNYEDLKVEYDGKKQIYYFLAQYADPKIVPWVHTVMYYNLFDDAGGAYLHNRFDEHREFLLARLKDKKPVAYFPESAYWVAFDNSVPTYLPVYIRSRFTDMKQIGNLDQHITFSSGWEWGYWQNDYATLRMNFQTPSRWEETVTQMWAPLGDAASTLSEAVIALANTQYQYLIKNRLAPYLAGRDATIDLGDKIGIVSQPDRPSMAEVLAFVPKQRAQFETNILGQLNLFADDMQKIEDTIKNSPPNNYIDEIRDGIAVTILRTRFIEQIYRAVFESVADKNRAKTTYANAKKILDQARPIVMRRHQQLHYPNGANLTQLFNNPTIYQYGYLRQADMLCYWQRELIQADNVLTGATSTAPDCFLK